MLEVEGIDVFSERGDAPAQAVLQDNSRARALRKAAETQEELTLINDRVSRTIDAYELSELLAPQVDDSQVQRIAEEYIREEANLEFVDDMTQLMVILSDPVAKRKYQQQVTVFIVGFENLCGRRARLLAQLQEFFNQNSLEDDTFELEPPEFDIEDVGRQVSEALGKAENATKRLATVSKDVLKALEVANPKETKKGKKKLEKAIHQSQQDIISLTEKLMKVQHELAESEGKMSQMYKTMEMKQVEIERLKVQVDSGKKAVDNLNEVKAEMAMKDEELQRSNKIINDLELSVGHLEDKQGRDYERQRAKREENQKVKEGLEEKVRDQQQFIAELRSDLQKQYDSKVKALVGKHEEQLRQLREDHQGEIYRTHKALEAVKKKNDELKAELGNLSKRNSLSVSTGTTSKRNSLFSPDDSEADNSPRRASFKSSANSIKMMLTKKSETDPSSSGIGSTSQTPLGKTSSDSDSSLTKEASQGGKEPAPPALTRSDSKTPNEKVEAKGDSKAKPKSPEKKSKTKGDKKTHGQRGEASGTTEDHQGPGPSQPAAPTKVDVGVQSDLAGDKIAEDRARLLTRKSSILEIVPEEKEQENTEEEATELDVLSKDELLTKMDEYKSKSQEKQQKLQEELTELKNKYIAKTSSLKQHIDESSSHFAKEKEELLRQAKEADILKHQAEKEAEQAMLQLEEMLAEQDELRAALKEKAKPFDRSEQTTMTGLSLQGRGEEDEEGAPAAPQRREVETSTSLSLVSRRDEHTMTSQSLGTDQGLASNHSLGSQASLQTKEGLESVDAVDADLGNARVLSPRDSGFEGTGSSRPSTSTVNVLSPKVEVEEATQAPDEAPGPASRSGTLSIPDRRATLMSARARRRLVNSALQENPVAEETVRTYETVLKFKDKAASWLEGQELRREASELAALPPVALDKDDRVQVIESLPLIRGSVAEVLGTFNEILSSKLLASEEDKERASPESRTRGESTPVQLVNAVGSAASRESGTRAKIEGSYSQLLKEHNDLTENHERLRQHLDEETKFHQEQTSQNAAVMAEMQDTINQLKEQLADAMRGRTSSSGRASSSIMFTRLDAERNAKTLKRATNEDRMSDESYSELLGFMDEYVSLPAKRLAHIVRRYSHHCAMKEIEESLKQSGSLDTDVFGALERMELLQNQRARRWGDRMDQLATERDRLAQLMTTTFDKIEQDTGIFLIKPVYSYKARSTELPSTKRRPPQPSSQPGQPSGPATPAPTPWQRRVSKTPLSVSDVPQGFPRAGASAGVPSAVPSAGPPDQGAMFMKGSQPGRELAEGFSAGPMWQASRSQVLGTPPAVVPLTSPRILELDVNRVIIAQNQISTELQPDSRVRADSTSSAVRSYVTVERPSGGKQMRKARRHAGPGSEYSGAQSPPNTPSKLARGNSASSLVQFPPLPPIRMPELPEESRSSKSIRSYPESEALTQSVPGSPFSIARLDEQRPNTRETGGKRTFTPDTVSVR